MKKIVFADQLRCIAALAVVFLHLAGGYWAWRPDIAARIMAPPLEGPNSLQLYAANVFNFGPFGVSLFFLISGFVIPLSLEKLNAGRFLLARAFRIYPTYFACLAVTAGAAWLSSRYWHQPFTLDRHSFIMNALLVHNFTGVPSFDMVNWTLAIEVKFYLIMALLSVFSLHRQPLALIAVAVVIALGIVFVPRADVAATWILRDLAFVPYMMIGTLISLHMRREISSRFAGMSIAALALTYTYIFFYYFAIRKEGLPVTLDIYLSNVAVFLLAYVLRDKFKPNRAIDFFARISYPLYAVHPIVGYASLRFLMARGVPPMVSLGITLIAVVAIAYVVHRLIEIPSQRVGKWAASIGSAPVATSATAT